MKKRILMLFLALIGLGISAYADDRDKPEPNLERYNVSDSNGKLAFGKCYYELNGRPSGANGNFYDVDHAKWSMKGWPEAGKHVVTYLHFPACTSDASIQLNTSGDVTLRVVVMCMEDSTQIATKQVNISAGDSKWVKVMDETEMPRSAWYKFDIECVSGATNVGELFYWQFNKTANTERVYTADYMSSPSVHLGSWRTTDPKAPAAGRYDWVYQEVMIPESSAVVGTYCMSLGILHGYMGIQIDSENDYPIIFSMWDNGSTDKDPNLPDYLRSGALDNEDGVTIARFGGEGTGAQAKRRTGQNWIPGQWVRFIANCRPEIVEVEVPDTANPGHTKTITYTNTLCTAWYMAEGKDKEWQYLATIRQSGANNYFDGWYSFLENYNWPSGQWQRKAYYRNGGLHSMVDGKWYDANKVNFGNTDGGDKYGDRQDYGQGVTTDFPNCFFMSSGGYKEAPVQNASELPLRTNIMPVSQEELEMLAARVDQAIQKEQQTKMAEEFEKAREELSATGFTVVGNNSEADNEDKAGVSNRATSATDGDENSYWHTRWSSGTGNGTNVWPYYIDIQVADEEMAKEIEQIALYQSRPSDYRGKKLQVLVSNDQTNWTDMGTYDLADENRPVVNLNTRITSKRYIRLQFTQGYGSWIVLNEVYFRTAVSRDALNEKVQAMFDLENQFNGYSDEDLLPLRTAYAEGQWADAQAVKNAMVNVAETGTVLKFGVPNALNSISSFKAYQLHNIFGMGDVIVSGENAAQAQCGTFDVTDQANNWLLLRSEKWNSYYLYNLSAAKYLTVQNGAIALAAEPSPVQVSVRTVNIDGTNHTAFTICMESANNNSYLTAGSNALSLGANTTNGAAWELRDNYGITPDVDTVNGLLEAIKKHGIPGFDKDSYSIRLYDQQLYLTTTDFQEAGGRWTYCTSANPEYFKVIPSGNGYKLQSVTTGKYVGHNHSWDITNTADVWQIASIEEDVPVGIYKSGTTGLGMDDNHSVYNNKTGFTWVFQHFVDEEEEVPTTCHLTYRYQYNGLEDVTENFTVQSGEALPAPTRIPYGVELRRPLGYAEKDSVYTIPYTFIEDYPIQFTSEPGSASTWYNLKVRGNKIVGLTDAGAPAASADTEPSHIAFVGTPWQFEIYYYEADGVLGGTASNEQDATIVELGSGNKFVFEKNEGHNAFRLLSTTNGYLNNLQNRDRFGYWLNDAASTDPGSTFVIEETITPIQRVTIGLLVQLIEWAKEGYVDMDQILEAVDQILERKPVTIE